MGGYATSYLFSNKVTTAYSASNIPDFEVEFLIKNSYYSTAKQILKAPTVH